MKEPLSSQRPNIIWFFADQLRAQAMGYRGDPNVYTPNIDNFAREAVRFDAAVAGSPWCSPFRGALLTGQYPHQNGVTRTPSALDPRIPTLVQPLKEAGYRTCYVGKWHLDGSNDREHGIPPERRGGFDFWCGYENNNNQNEVYVHGDGVDEKERLPGYETDSLMDIFLGRLDVHAQESARREKAGEEAQPFFGVLSVQPPHSPYVSGYNPVYGTRQRNPAGVQLRPNVPPVPWVQEKAALDLDGYYHMIESLDHQLGRLRAHLKKLGMDTNTTVFFFSDHGDMMGSHAQWEKSSPWEESIRIPLLVGRVGMGINARSGICDAPFNHVDFAPTTLGLCGVEVPESMKGFDYSRRIIHRKDPMFKGEPDTKEEPDSAYLQQIPRKFHPHSVNKAWRAVVTRDRWKYVCTPGNDWLMHNLNDDPYEMANLAHDSAFQSERERLHQCLSDWVTHTGDSFDLPPVALK